MALPAHPDTAAGRQYEIVFDALVDGIPGERPEPEAWTRKLPGTDFEPIVRNADHFVAVAKAMSDALEGIQKDVADPMFDAVEKGLAPVTHALDDINAQVEAAIDNALKVNGSTANKSGAQAITSVPSSGSQLKTLSIEAAETDTSAKSTPLKDTLKDALKDVGLDHGFVEGQRDLQERHEVSESVKIKPEAKAGLVTPPIRRIR